jgi:hypothetical protein
MQLIVVAMASDFRAQSEIPSQSTSVNNSVNTFSSKHQI